MVAGANALVASIMQGGVGGVGGSTDPQSNRAANRELGLQEEIHGLIYPGRKRKVGQMFERAEVVELFKSSSWG